MVATQYPLVLPAEKPRSMMGRAVWWVLFVPRFFAGMFAAAAVGGALSNGDDMSGWAFLAAVAAFWVISPFRLWRTASRLRRRRIRRRAIAEWKQHAGLVEADRQRTQANADAAWAQYWQARNVEPPAPVNAGGHAQ